MHPALRREFENLKALADKKEKPVAIMETQLENVAFISSGEKLVCLVILEEEIHNLLSCYRVNLSKWKYAQDEGFGVKDIPECLGKEILIKFNSPTEYLRYLDF
jgi:hypothetical protein